jgi:hypothetical protein
VEHRQRYGTGRSCRRDSEQGPAVSRANSNAARCGPCGEVDPSPPYDEVQRAVAYAFARNGDRQQAIREPESYLAAHAELQSDLDYVVARVAEARALKEQLLKEPSAALRQLQEWEDATRAALGLREYNFLSDVLKHGV